MVSTMSMKAGHSCTHAMQVVQAHSSSAWISSPWMGPGSSPSSMWRLSLTMICLGFSAAAGQVGGARVLAAAALHAGVEVQPPLPGKLLELGDAEALRPPRCSRSWRWRPGAPSLEKKMFSGVVIRCMKYECGTMAMKSERDHRVEEPDSEVECRAARPPRAPPPGTWPAPARSPPGDHGAHHGFTTASRHASMTNPVSVDHEQHGQHVGEAARWDRPAPAADEAAAHRHAEPDHEEEAEQVEHQSRSRGRSRP